jgi:F-type H+-transporting ATPase subunit b
MNIPLNIDWQQILLHLFNFAILFGGLYLLLYKPIKEFMEKRIAYYEKMEADTKQNLANAKLLHTEYENQLANTETEIDRMRESAKEELAAWQEEELLKAKKEAETILANARKEAEKDCAKMQGEAQQAIADTAVSLAKKMVQDNISKEQEKSLFEEILGKAGNTNGI